MGSQVEVEVEVSGCFCLQYKSIYATSFHPHFLLLFFALRNCWNRCQIVVHFVFFVAFPLYLFSFPSWWWPLLFSFVLVHWLCAVSNFCETPKPPAPKLLLWGPQSICSPRIGQHDMSSLRFQRSRECRK